MTVEWQTGYQIGDGEVDAMQEKLFALTNAFLASDESGVMNGSVVDYDQAIIGAGNAPVPRPEETR